MDEIFKPDNKLDDVQFILSPTGKYQLIISSYKTGDKTWNYTKGTIKRVVDDHIITEIKRNFYDFHYSFFIRQGQEWLQTGQTYMCQSFVNLDTGDIYDNADQLKLTKEYTGGSSFCWARSQISPDGNTLAVVGCIWGGPYFYKFYDFTDPSTGWPELEDDDFYEENDNDQSEWKEDGTFIICEREKYINYNGQLITHWSEEYFKLPSDIKYSNNYSYEITQRRILKRDNHEMITVNLWKSDKKIKQEEEWEKKDREQELRWETLKTESEIYQQFNKLLHLTKYNIGFNWFYTQGKEYFNFSVATYKDNDSTPHDKKRNCQISWDTIDSPIKMTLSVYGKSHLIEKLYPRELTSINQIMEDLTVHLD